MVVGGGWLMTSSRQPPPSLPPLLAASMPAHPASTPVLPPFLPSIREEPEGEDVKPSFSGPKRYGLHANGDASRPASGMGKGGRGR